MALAMLHSCYFPAFGLLAAVEHAFKKASLSVSSVVGIVFFASMILRLSLLPVSPVPAPVIRGEFSYLLAGILSPMAGSQSDDPGDSVRLAVAGFLAVCAGLWMEFWPMHSITSLPF